jgi:hypothetical protein
MGNLREAILCIRENLYLEFGVTDIMNLEW